MSQQFFYLYYQLQVSFFNHLILITFCFQLGLAYLKFIFHISDLRMKYFFSLHETMEDKIRLCFVFLSLNFNTSSLVQ